MSEQQLPTRDELEEKIYSLFMDHAVFPQHVAKQQASLVEDFLELSAVNLRMFECIAGISPHFYMIYEDMAEDLDRYTSPEVFNYFSLNFGLPLNAIHIDQCSSNYIVLERSWYQMLTNGITAFELSAKRSRISYRGEFQRFLSEDLIDRSIFCSSFESMFPDLCTTPKLDNRSTASLVTEAERTSNYTVRASNPSSAAYDVFNLLAKRFLMWWLILGNDPSFFPCISGYSSHVASADLPREYLFVLLCHSELLSLHIDMERLTRLGLYEVL